MIENHYLRESGNVRLLSHGRKNSLLLILSWLDLFLMRWQGQAYLN